MSIAVISVSNIYAMPYYYKYEKQILESHDFFDLIYWDRAIVEEKVDPRVKCICFHKKCAYNDENPFKIFDFFRFNLFVRKTIRQNLYDKLIILGTYSLLTFFMMPLLTTTYKGRYVLDIRDYTYEHIKPFFMSEKRVIESAYRCFISSEGYKEFLPACHYEMIHNCDMDTIHDYLQHERDYQPCAEGKIRISFIGNVRYLEENRRLLEMFGNDDRFLLQYFGSGSEKIKDIADTMGIHNVKFHGKFSHEDTYLFYIQTDIINNVYGNGGIELTTALSNKLYYSSALNKPILVSPHTYMEKISVENGIGFVVDYANPRLNDELYTWYSNYLKGNNTKNTLMKKVMDDEDKYKQIMKAFCCED